jgi:hypothetical protein
MAEVAKKSSKRLEAANVSLNDSVRKGEIYRKTVMQQKYLKQEKVPVTISPMYKPYFGEVMEIIINGIYVSVPCDGKVHKIPKTFANEVNARILAVDDAQRRADRMADVAKNREEIAGDIKFFG